MKEEIVSKEETFYDCVQSLISAEPRAKAFYMTLDEREQGKIILHADTVCSYTELERFVQDMRA